MKVDWGGDFSEIQYLTLCACRFLLKEALRIRIFSTQDSTVLLVLLL